MSGFISVKSNRLKINYNSSESRLGRLFTFTPNRTNVKRTPSVGGLGLLFSPSSGFLHKRSMYSIHTSPPSQSHGKVTSSPCFPLAHNFRYVLLQCAYSLQVVFGINHHLLKGPRLWRNHLRFSYASPYTYLHVLYMIHGSQVSKRETREARDDQNISNPQSVFHTLLLNSPCSSVQLSLQSPHQPCHLSSLY